MNSIKLILISVILIFVVQVTFTQNSDGPTEITQALNNGDAGKLSAQFNANVELVLGKINDVLSKQQASGIISDFFKKNKVTSFVVLHNGKKESSGFTIGTLKTNNGDFRVYILTRKSGSQTLIQQLRLETTND
jgi:hypothetical protein